MASWSGDKSFLFFSKRIVAWREKSNIYTNTYTIYLIHFVLHKLILWRHQQRWPYDDFILCLCIVSPDDFLVFRFFFFHLILFYFLSPPLSFSLVRSLSLHRFLVTRRKFEVPYKISIEMGRKFKLHELSPVKFVALLVKYWRRKSSMEISLLCVCACICVHQ